MLRYTTKTEPGVGVNGHTHPSVTVSLWAVISTPCPTVPPRSLARCSELTLLCSEHPMLPQRLSTRIETIMAISLSAANCLPSVSSLLPQPSPCLLTLMHLSHNLIFIPVTGVQMPTSWLFSLLQIHYLFSSLFRSPSPGKTIPSSLSLLIIPHPQITAILLPPNPSQARLAHFSYLFWDGIFAHVPLHLLPACQCVSGQLLGPRDISCCPCRWLPGLILALHQLQ